MPSNDPIWNGFLNVVVLPPPEVRDYAIELSAKLYERGLTSWKLGLEERRPHISLFHFPLRAGLNAGDAVAALHDTIFGGDLHHKGGSSLSRPLLIHKTFRSLLTD